MGERDHGRLSGDHGHVDAHKPDRIDAERLAEHHQLILAGLDLAGDILAQVRTVHFDSGIIGIGLRGTKDVDLLKVPDGHEILEAISGGGLLHCMHLFLCALYHGMNKSPTRKFKKIELLC